MIRHHSDQNLCSSLDCIGQEVVVKNMTYRVEGEVKIFGNGVKIVLFLKKCQIKMMIKATKIMINLNEQNLTNV